MTPPLVDVASGASESAVAHHAAVKAQRNTLASTGALSCRRIGEENDAYPYVVIHESERVRINECKTDLQWIIQHREAESNSWRGRGFYRIRAALVRDYERLSDTAASVLAVLPERYESRSKGRWLPWREREAWPLPFVGESTRGLPASQTRE
jgi:hypothetical protein